MMKAIVVAVLACSSEAYAGACAVPTMAATVLTPAGTTVDSGGGIVVGITGESATKTPQKNVGALDWKLVERGRRTAPKQSHVLAPGLAVLELQPPASPGGGPLALESGDKEALGTVTYATGARSTVPGPAPAVSALTYSSAQSPRGSYESITAALRTPPPAGTVALLIYSPAAYKSGGAARSWVRASPDAGASLSIMSHGRCQVVVDGLSEPIKGDTVVLVWLDAGGHRSAPSAELAVR